MRARASSLSTSPIRLRLTWRSMLRSIVAMARSSAAGFRSSMVTGSPASAQTCAMPLPICPAPITPTPAIGGGSASSVPPAGEGFTSMFISGALQFLCQLWQCRKQISHQAVIGDLEDGRFLVLVDGHDDLAVLHTSKVL